MSASIRALFVALALTGCFGSGDDDDAANASQSLSCAEGEFVLSGILDGEDVSHTGTVGGHAWVQTGDSNTFDVSLEPVGSVHTEWAKLVAEGQSTAITGYVSLPSGGPHGGETLTAGSGTMTKNDDTVSFDLSDLDVSVQCVTDPCPAQRVEGTLSGCVHWKKLDF